MRDLELTRIPALRPRDQIFVPLQGHVTGPLAARPQKKAPESIVIDLTGSDEASSDPRPGQHR